jgi:hypothetical protein
MHVYIEHAENPAVRFEVIEFDKATGIGKIKGGYGAVITRNISKEELTKRGYVLRTSEKPLSLTPPPKIAAEE